MGKVDLIVVAVVLLAVCVGGANAGLITIVGDLGDGQIGADGSVAGISVPQDRTGTGGNNNRGLALIYFFQLPTLSPVTWITSATLEFEYTEKELNPEFNIDLFGIAARPNAVFDASDYYDGNAALSADTLIQSAMIGPATPLGEINVANLNLLNFVNSLYNPDGTSTSTFATFRVNPDKELPVGSPPIRGYFLALADNSNLGFRPVLTLTTTTVATGVPEPSSLALALMVGPIGVAVGLRRKRND